MIIHKVHCEWGDWIVGECSQSCGGGTRTNTREPKVLAEHGGEECHGPASMDENCNVQNCQGMNLFEPKLNIITNSYTLFVPASKCKISFIGDRFYLYEKGKKQCPTNSAVLDIDECKEACTTLGIRLSNNFKNGLPCFKGGNGVCKQSSNIGSRSTLVCKTIGSNIYICRAELTIPFTKDTDPKS